MSPYQSDSFAHTPTCLSSLLCIAACITAYSSDSLAANTTDTAEAASQSSSAAAAATAGAAAESNSSVSAVTNVNAEQWYAQGLRWRRNHHSSSGGGYGMYDSAPWWPGQCIDCSLAGASADSSGTFCGESGWGGFEGTCAQF